ncbi:MAG: RNA methyltransferase, partial [Bdellovibrionales bacterium]|nr:RNA methyltransferase [Bdellovibrionales bacterium]
DPSDLNSEIEVQWNQTPIPTPLPLTVCIALPRPKACRRLLFSLSVLGIKEVHLFHAYRVEKSYWTSPLLTSASVHEFLLHGLEQAGDTLLPSVHFHHRFRPFAEDQLPVVGKNKDRILLDKWGDPLSRKNLHEPTCVVIGPEGGFIDFEVGLLQENGFKAHSLGNRILTVELAATTFASFFRV